MGVWRRDAISQLDRAPDPRVADGDVRGHVAALAHSNGDAAEQAHRRGDAPEKRRRLMADWATFCG